MMKKQQSKNNLFKHVGIYLLWGLFTISAIVTVSCTNDGNGGPDTTAPLLSSVSTSSESPKEVILTFSEAVQNPLFAKFTVNVNDANNPVTAAAIVSGDDTKVKLTLTSDLALGNEIKVTFEAGAVQDKATIPNNIVALSTANAASTYQIPTTNPPTPGGTPIATLTVASSDFTNNQELTIAHYGKIGASSGGTDFGAGAKNISPQLGWTSTDARIKSYLVLAVDDTSSAGDFFHWFRANITPDGSGQVDLARDIGKTTSVNQGVTSWINDGTGVTSRIYSGPQPPFGYHNYKFLVFGIDKTSIAFNTATPLADLGWYAQLVTFYKRKTSKSSADVAFTDANATPVKVIAIGEINAKAGRVVNLGLEIEGATGSDFTNLVNSADYNLSWEEANGVGGYLVGLYDKTISESHGVAYVATTNYVFGSPNSGNRMGRIAPRLGYEHEYFFYVIGIPTGAMINYNQLAGFGGMNHQTGIYGAVTNYVNGIKAVNQANFLITVPSTVGSDISIRVSSFASRTGKGTGR